MINRGSRIHICHSELLGGEGYPNGSAIIVGEGEEPLSACQFSKCICLCYVEIQFAKVFHVCILSMLFHAHKL